MLLEMIAYLVSQIVILVLPVHNALFAIQDFIIDRINVFHPAEMAIIKM